MAKRPPVPHLTAWEWLCEWARQHGVEPELVQMSDAAEHLVMALEQKRAAGNSLPRSAVQLTALLVRITGELEIEGIEPTWAAAQSRIELAFARRRAAALNIMRDQAPLPKPKREIAQPEEPVEALSVTLFDMLRTFEQILEKTRKDPVPRSPDSLLVASIPVHRRINGASRIIGGNSQISTRCSHAAMPSWSLGN